MASPELGAVRVTGEACSGVSSQVIREGHGKWLPDYLKSRGRASQLGARPVGLVSLVAPKQYVPLTRLSTTLLQFPQL